MFVVHILCSGCYSLCVYEPFIYILNCLSHAICNLHIYDMYIYTEFEFCTTHTLHNHTTKLIDLSIQSKLMMQKSCEFIRCVKCVRPDLFPFISLSTCSYTPYAYIIYNSTATVNKFRG